MLIYKPENPADESEIVYVCDNCGGMSNFSDYWWPGHKHWEELNYTLCYDCLQVLSGYWGNIGKKATGEKNAADKST
jgi:hypothetical protein